MFKQPALIRLLCFICGLVNFCFAQSGGSVEPLHVRKCADFIITGKGDNKEWEKSEWHSLLQLDSASYTYESRFKILYSAKGIYVFFSGKDNKISTTYDKDFGDLFRGDVFEVFFHPNPDLSLYFEYEINQLNKELVLMIPNFNGSFYGWVPWHYEKEPAIKKMVSVKGGKAGCGESISSWTAELFFPYQLLLPLTNVPPASGAIWNANFCRLDYDDGNMIKWSWSPIEQSFHEYKKYRSIKFE